MKFQNEYFDFSFCRLFDEIEELKTQPVRDTDEEMYQLRENYDHLHAEWKNLRTGFDTLQRENDQSQRVIEKQKFDLQKQVENVACLNDEVSFLFTQGKKKKHIWFHLIKIALSFFFLCI